MTNKSKSRTDRILAISAGVTAVAAVVVSVWQGCETRRHNRLSVKPHLIIFPQRPVASPEIGLQLANRGSGSALIKSWEISVDQEGVGSHYYGWVEALGRLQIKEGWIHVSSYTALRAGKSRPIFWVYRDQWENNLSEEQKIRFQNAIRRISVSIEYESIYEEQFAPCEFDGAEGW